MFPSSQLNLDLLRKRPPNAQTPTTGVNTTGNKVQKRHLDTIWNSLYSHEKQSKWSLLTTIEWVKQMKRIALKNVNFVMFDV